VSEASDVLIAGAGLPGLALAAALKRAGMSVVLADRNPIAAPEPDPATFDTRVYAISPGSAEFLHSICTWQRLPRERVTPIETMDVRGDAGARLEFSSYAIGEAALAWIVEERELRAALLEVVHASGVEVIGGVRFESLRFDADCATLTFADGDRRFARLLVGADGARSWVREAAGIAATPRGYGQTAVVANFCCERAHHQVARQWFMDDGGVLAWLPLPGRRISIVWSAPDALAGELMALSPTELASRVAGAGEDALGVLEPLTAAASFPLQFLKLSTSVAHRLALVGDAAHAVHPLAGQGVNLGFGDAFALTRILKERGAIADPGAPILLSRYARQRAEPVLAMQTVTDGLARLFGSRVPWQRALRNLGLAAVDRLPIVKRALSQPALK
jgi:ubiquinone biosynthesis UbiH/UbiF/VisC/COQ6 family hydroxylase